MKPGPGRSVAGPGTLSHALPADHLVAGQGLDGVDGDGRGVGMAGQVVQGGRLEDRGLAADMLGTLRRPRLAYLGSGREIYRWRAGRPNSVVSARCGALVSLGQGERRRLLNGKPGLLGPGDYMARLAGRVHMSVL